MFIKTSPPKEKREEGRRGGKIFLGNIYRQMLKHSFGSGRGGFLRKTQNNHFSMLFSCNFNMFRVIRQLNCQILCRTQHDKSTK